MTQVSDISYSLPEAIILTIGIELALLPIIIYSKLHCTILLGKKNKVKFGDFKKKMYFCKKLSCTTNNK